MKFDVNSLLKHLSEFGYDCVILIFKDGIWSLDHVGRICSEEEGDSQC